MLENDLYLLVKAAQQNGYRMAINALAHPELYNVESKNTGSNMDWASFLDKIEKEVLKDKGDE
jgi:hypothetical protein